MRLYELKDGTYAEPKIARRCKWEGCKTILADKNENDYCFAHLTRGIERDWEIKKKPIHAKIKPEPKQRRKNKRIGKCQRGIIKRWAC